MNGMTLRTRVAGGLIFVLAGMTPPGMRAQQGDKAGEEQPVRVAWELIPPAPALPPREALRTLTVREGFRVELAAHEPMVETPVAMAFGADGRMWVVEMRGFMPNADGKGEEEIPGRVVILEDRDGDGGMDRRKVFLDGLIMPRAIAMTGDGVLVAEPPKLWHCRDTDGDDVCDEKTEVAGDYGDRKNPEHTANGLVRAMDNWYYSLYHTYRYRRRDGQWERQPVPNRVQWGLSQDSVGRLFFTSNSDQLRGDLVPSHYGAHAPGLKLPGLNERIAADQSVWPSRVNPGVNRGYQPNTLRPDGTLARFTAACGTVIYRGDWFPSEFQGNAFVCEPSGNLIRRSILVETDGQVTAKNAYERGEFLTSTDERFRPVNLYTGPDGALYVVDMYHGILQHRIYLTSYLRKQAESRGLEGPLHQGRIYRIAPEGGAGRPEAVRLAGATAAELAERLTHPNGWVRDTAQRLLVEGAGGRAAAAELRRLARSHPEMTARLHALWTLEGLGELNRDAILSSLSDASPKVRAAGLRLAEASLRVLDESPGLNALRDAVVALSNDASVEVRRQLALTLGVIAYGPSIKQTLAGLSESKSPGVKAAAEFSLGLREPKKSQAPAVAKGRPLTREEQARFEMGRGVYEATCIACHQPHGLGQEGLAPPLVDTEWIQSSPERLSRMVLHGIRGKMMVKGQEYELDMPSLAVLDDDQIAAVLTYVRREWGHAYDPVDPATVKKARAETADRVDAWTAEELLKIP